MKFSEMPYERPDLDAVKKQYSALTERLKAAGSYEEARTVFFGEGGAGQARPDPGHPLPRPSQHRHPGRLL